MTTRVLRGVVDNFLRCYLSRYSDYQGYWLFGFLVPDLTAMRVNLLRPPADDRPAFKYAIDLAAQRFRDQLQKGRVSLEQVRMADLELFRALTKLAVEVNGNVADGWVLRASVVVESVRGRQFNAERCVLVAPHNEAVELRSTRAA
jgi:hypothetical protein